MEKKTGAGRLAGTLLGAAVLSFLATVVILLALAFAALKLQPDMGKIKLGILAAYVLSCLLGGRYAGKKAEKRKFLWGLLAGILYFALLAAVSVLGQDSLKSDLVQKILALALCAGGGMLGGMTA